VRHTEAKAKAREREAERLQQLCLEQLNQSSPGGIFLISFQLGLHRPSAKPTNYALAAARRGAQCGGSTAAAVDHAAQRISNIHRRFAELQQPKPQRIEAVRRGAR
jgi:hypothetical protein